MNDCGNSCLVILNCEDECAIWPVGPPLPATWRPTGVRGTAVECEAYIKALDGEKCAGALRQQLESEQRRP